MHFCSFFYCQVQDKGKLGKFHVQYTVVLCVLVIVAPPIVVGVWSMAFLLRQHVEYCHTFYLAALVVHM